MVHVLINTKWLDYLLRLFTNIVDIVYYLLNHMVNIDDLETFKQNITKSKKKKKKKKNQN